jgi:hypothetical protein
MRLQTGGHFDRYALSALGATVPHHLACILPRPLYSWGRKASWFDRHDHIHIGVVDESAILETVLLAPG